jgi:hypothetical protein
MSSRRRAARHSSSAPRRRPPRERRSSLVGESPDEHTLDLASSGADVVEGFETALDRRRTGAIKVLVEP